MKKRFIYCIVLISLFPVVAGQAFADGMGLGSARDFRCHGKIVSIGDTQYDVMKKCKEPTSKAKFDSVWVYDFGPYRLTYYVIFLDGRVHRIRTATGSK